MRRTFVGKLADLAREDERIIFISGDLGFNVVEEFVAEFPDRFINAGVAEQNMVGVATGLAQSGYLPFVYSIVTFAALRPYEFIRNGPVMHNLPVRVVAIGGGLEYADAGHTHFGLEDIGVMRMHPNMTVIAPGDARQAASALQATWDLTGPVYYRLGKNDNTSVPGLDGRFDLGSIQEVRDGDRVALLVTGSVAPVAVAAAEELARKGIEASVAIVPVLQPAPLDALIDYISRYEIVGTIEAHYVAGGLGSLVSEVVASEGLDCRVQRHGIHRLVEGVTGHEDYLLDLYGLTAKKISDATIAAFGGPERGLTEVPL